MRTSLYRWAVCLHLRRPETPDMKRFREIFDLNKGGVAMRRQRMRNENPHAKPAEIDAMVRAWLLKPRKDQTLSPPPGKRDDDDSR